MTVAQPQHILDKSREENPAAVFIVHVKGAISVSSVPLSVHDRTCMFLDKDGQVVASAGCTADSLLRIVDGEYVSVTGNYDPRRGGLGAKKYVLWEW